MVIFKILEPKVKGTEGNLTSGVKDLASGSPRAWPWGTEAEPYRTEHDARMACQASVPRDVFPPTPPGPEGSNGNGLLRVQWGAGAWLRIKAQLPQSVWA